MVQDWKSLTETNAVVAFNIARIFESAPKLPNEKRVNGIALFVIANTNECFQVYGSSCIYLFLSRMRIKTDDAISSLI